MRLTQEACAAQGGALHYPSVDVGALIEGQLVRLTACAGEHWGRGMAGARRAYELANRLRDACEAAGLEVPPRAFAEQLWRRRCKARPNRDGSRCPGLTATSGERRSRCPAP